MDYIDKYVWPVDPEIAEAINREEQRQATKLGANSFRELCFPCGDGCPGGVMTNKYAEGIRKRYYGGCEFVDVAEELARKEPGCFRRLMLMFNPIQELKPTLRYISRPKTGDTIMGRTGSWWPSYHGSPVNLSGTYFNVVSYGVDSKTETIDYEQVMEIAHRARPKMIVVGASAYPAKLIIRYLKHRGFSPSSVDGYSTYSWIGSHRIISSPVPYADFVTTTTHKTLRGPRGMIFCNQEWAARIDKAVFPGIGADH